MTNWTQYANFEKHEFDCKHTGNNRMQPEFLKKLQALRTEYGRPMRVTSGYRDPEHPIESRKSEPGQHSKGVACDIACWSDEAFKIVDLAFKHGFTGIGISQNSRGARFVHLDIRDSVPVIYSY